ncbi:hypothetical protein AGMMS50256_33980 [Betaproteobacteria bacterium]|nr:hypothetical protein AGMMS50256_33980 [Betaproteobacteria bacterium]
MGASQQDWAELLAVTRQTIAEWEAGNSAPDTVQLGVLAKSGVDALYVVTGQRSAGNVTPKETTLLDNFRNSSETGQDAILRTAFALAEQKIKGVSA